MLLHMGVNRLGQRLFLVAAVIYVAVILYLGRFDMVLLAQDYGKAAARLQPGYAISLVQRETADRCQTKAAAENGPLVDACLQAAESGMDQRVVAKAADLAREKRQVTIKLILFYSMLFLLMILLPVVVAYMGLALFLFLIREMRVKTD